MKDKKIAVIGGGTGISSVLRGLKKYTSELSAIVTMADDGGSSGSLRRDYGVLPPGDIRNCLVALANVEPVLEHLLQYRYDSGVLKGQNLGNLLISALSDMTGDFEEALESLSKVLKITGQVLPVTVENVNLVASFSDGARVFGESKIAGYGAEHHSYIKELDLIPYQAKATRSAVRAVKEADFLILGPGSLYTSLIPNLLFTEIIESLLDSQAPLIYIANIMTQPGETGGMSLAEHVETLERYGLYGRIDGVLVHDGFLDEELLYRYALLENALPLLLTQEDREFFKGRGIQLITGDFIEDRRDFIRHSGMKIARILERF